MLSYLMQAVLLCAACAHEAQLGPIIPYGTRTEPIWISSNVHGQGAVVIRGFQGLYTVERTEWDDACDRWRQGLNGWVSKVTDDSHLAPNQVNWVKARCQRNAALGKPKNKQFFKRLCDLYRIIEIRHLVVIELTHAFLSLHRYLPPSWLTDWPNDWVSERITHPLTNTIQ